MIRRIVNAFTPWTLEDTLIASISGMSLVIACLAVAIAWF